MKISCVVNGKICSIDVSDVIAKLAEEKSNKTGQHVQSLLRKVYRPIKEAGEEPTAKDFENYLKKL